MLHMGPLKKSGFPKVICLLKKTTYECLQLKHRQKKSRWEKGLTCVVTGVPPSTTSDWLARNQIQQVRWELHKKKRWSTTIMWKEQSSSWCWLNIRWSVSVSGFLSPGLWSLPVFSFWCLALQPHKWPHEGIFLNKRQQKPFHHPIITPWACKTLQQRTKWTSCTRNEDIWSTSLVWGHTPAFWSVSPGPVSCSPALSSHPAETPPEPENTYTQN